MTHQIPVTLTSRKIAVRPGKRHLDVLRRIDKLPEIRHRELASGFRTIDDKDATDMQNRPIKLDLAASSVHREDGFETFAKPVLATTKDLTKFAGVFPGTQTHPFAEDAP
ncbi:hypothetical protein CCR95_16205 [Thiocystis minor]|uniref:hypothetical protein n=1 Tax=Thiocystis minor TaxID=61597 RepID=UPI00191224E1|nr:hypothetical protein [Thiocystis minor]MBK5965587.1 hypothetical protein [Thiocystis minor]